MFAAPLKRQTHRNYAPFGNVERRDGEIVRISDLAATLFGFLPLRLGAGDACGAGSGAESGPGFGATGGVSDECDSGETFFPRPP